MKQAIRNIALVVLGLAAMCIIGPIALYLLLRFFELVTWWMSLAIVGSYNWISTGHASAVEFCQNMRALIVTTVVFSGPFIMVYGMFGPKEEEAHGR